VYCESPKTVTIVLLGDVAQRLPMLVEHLLNAFGKVRQLQACDSEFQILPTVWPRVRFLTF
jgi:hypothetical protein